MGVLNRGGYTTPIVFDEKPTIFFKFSGTKASVGDNIKEVEAISKAHNGAAFRFARDKKEQDLLWSARKQALWSLLAARPEGTELWTTDVAVPYSHLATMIGEYAGNSYRVIANKMQRLRGRDLIVSVCLLLLLVI